eukprot:g21967.t1
MYRYNTTYIQHEPEPPWFAEWCQQSLPAELAIDVLRCGFSDDDDDDDDDDGDDKDFDNDSGNHSGLCLLNWSMTFSVWIQ